MASTSFVQGASQEQCITSGPPVPRSTKVAAVCAAVSVGRTVIYGNGLVAWDAAHSVVKLYRFPAVYLRFCEVSTGSLWRVLIAVLRQVKVQNFSICWSAEGLNKGYTDHGEC